MISSQLGCWKLCIVGRFWHPLATSIHFAYITSFLPPSYTNMMNCPFSIFRPLAHTHTTHTNAHKRPKTGAREGRKKGWHMGKNGEGCEALGQAQAVRPTHATTSLGCQTLFSWTLDGQDTFTLFLSSLGKNETLRHKKFFFFCQPLNYFILKGNFCAPTNVHFCVGETFFAFNLRRVCRPWKPCCAGNLPAGSFKNAKNFCWNHSKQHVIFTPLSLASLFEWHPCDVGKRKNEKKRLLP